MSSSLLICPFLFKIGENVNFVLQSDDIVIYKSTVWSGATEKVCIPVLEKVPALLLIRVFLSREESGAY